MRALYMAIGAFLLLSVFFFSSYSQSASAGQSNFTTIVNSTKAYLAAVNGSSYLLFYPNMSKAYSEFYLALNQSFNNQSRALALLNMSRQTASAQLSHIESYRSSSAYLLGVITISLAAVLYILMKPVRARTRTARSKARIR
ncbi:MAG: hypothetical protein KGH66_02075 [Candidatus Micrarchaeota archaeon]|nr:hypothetical protein [Candidatus Micrarchaeota archaeon]